MTHNVQKGGDFLKSYSANWTKLHSFRERTVKKGRVLLTSTRDGKIPSKLCGWHFLLGVVYHFANCLGTSGWKATEYLKRLSCFFSLLDEMFSTEIFVSLVKSHLWVSFKPWDWFVWIIGPNRERSVAHVNGKQIRSSRILSRKYNYERGRVQWIPTDEQTAWPYISCRLSVYINKSKFIL